MEDVARKFESELETFRCECEEATQHFYAFLAVHALASDHEAVYKLLNTAPLFWNTCLRALQTAHLVALGRVFDQNSPHNVDRLLGVAQRHPEVFSKAALACRKQGDNALPPEWLSQYLQNAYEPTPKDFRHLRALVKKWRKVYEDKYRPLRHKVFAHAELSDKTEIAKLFARTNIRELQRLHIFFASLYVALWGLFFNGRKPALQSQRYSIKRIREVGPQSGRRGTVQEEITTQAEKFLVSASRLISVRKAVS
jgi:AbiU2